MSLTPTAAAATGRNPRRLRAPLVALTALALALVLGEIALRVLAPELRYAPPTVRSGQGVEPLGDIARVLRERGSGTSSRADFECRICYDRPRWDYFDAQGCVDVHTNSLGLRCAEVPREKPAGEVRVLAQGDSFTFGLGVPAEAAWPGELERILREASVAGAHGTVRVVNAGFAGGEFRPVGYRRWLESTGFGLAPDAVVVGFCLNDVHTNVPVAILPSPLSSRWLGGVSTLLNRVQQAWHARAEERRLSSVPPDVARRAMERYLTDGGEWEESRTALLGMASACRERGIPLLVAVFPMLSRLARDYPYRPLHEAVLAFCTENGIACIDLGPRLVELARSGTRDEELWVHPTDQHPAPFVHRIFAEEIAAALAPELRRP